MFFIVTLLGAIGDEVWKGLEEGRMENNTKLLLLDLVD